MQVLNNIQSPTPSNPFPMAVSGLIKSTIVLAPDMEEMPRLVMNMKNIYSNQFRTVKLARMSELANKSSKAKEDTEKVLNAFNEIMETMHRLFSQKSLTFKSEGERQACMWLLCTMFADNLNLPNEKFVFYSGIGFGEFWAVTYRMWQTGQISFREAVWQTKLRGDRMTLLTEKYYRIVVKEEDKKTLYAMISKNSNIGILTLKNNKYFLYGTQRDLQKIANYYKLEMQESIPYFTQYYSQFIRCYAKRFPCAESGIDSQVILAKEARTIENLIVRQCCNGFNEHTLREEIACYEPFELKVI